MVTVSEQIERKKKKQKGSVNATVRGNGLVNEVVTIVAEGEGRGTEETEKGRGTVEGQIVIMTTEIAEGQLSIECFTFHIEGLLVAFEFCMLIHCGICFDF